MLSGHLIGTIARREVRDTLTDWRILLPIFILTFVLPQIIMGAAIYAIDFINDRNSIVTLIPFAMMLVGFIPSSFSLITALESFVGERERNSLEALLAMPISDGDLYVGKLLSSLLPPLLSSYLAMTIFGLSLLLVRPDLFFDAFDLQQLVLIPTLTALKAVAMVAGAVIISSHTNSIRAANLLASFVLLPMSALLQFESLLVIAKRWDILWVISLGMLVVACILARTGIRSFNREEILSREHEQLNIANIWQTFRTFFREYRPAGVAVTAYEGLPFRPSRFYRQELRGLLGELRLPMALALLGALLGVMFGVLLMQKGVTTPRLDEALKKAIGQPPDPGLPLLLDVLLRNARIYLLSNLFSTFAFGLFAFLVPVVAFAQIGYVGTWLAFNGGSPTIFVLAYVLPHGIIELPTALLSAAMGLRIGAAIMAPPEGFTVGQNLLWSLANFFKLYLLVLLPLALVGAIIEGLITPLIIAALY